MITRLLSYTARAALPVFLGLAGPTAYAEMRTLTDTQGRTIQADVMAVEGDQVKIRRADGQTFNLPMERLVEADQKALRAWAKAEAAKPQPLPPGAFVVQMSRGKFASETVLTDVNLVGGGTVKNGRETTEEKWGFSLMLNNRTSGGLDTLRAEYILFATQDDVHKDKVEGFRRARHRTKIDPVPAFGRLDFRTETVSVFKMKYRGNIVSASTGDNRSRETLHGIWIKIYRGDELIYEAASPESLMRTEKW
jgi:hypothetical protein